MQSAIALICSFAVVLSVFPVSADNEEINSLESQSSALQSELDGINSDILNLSEDISTTEMQLEVLNGEIARTSDELKVAEENEARQYAAMKTRIKYMYEHGNASLLEMLFSAESMVDFLNKADFIENLSEYDRNSLDELKAIHAEIQEQQETLQVQQSSLTDLQSQLKNQESELQAKASATSTNLADVQARLEKAKAEEAERIAAEEAAKKAAEEAEEAAAREASASAGNNSSQNSGGGSSSGSSQGGNSSGGGYDDSVINNGGTSASADDVTLLAAIIQCEAYQNYDSLLAVATVIMNRVESSRFPNSIRGVVYAKGQFEPVWTGRLDSVLSSGPTSLSMQVAQDAINGSRLAAVSDCYYFLYAHGSGRDGVVIGDNVFFQSW